MHDKTEDTPGINFIKNIFSSRRFNLPSTTDLTGTTVVTKLNINNSKNTITNEIGSLGLIPQSRPPNLPAKNSREESLHRKQHDAILDGIKKRELREQEDNNKKRAQQLKDENKLSSNLQYWYQKVIPNFNQLKSTTEVHDLWWQGIPSAVRGRIWCLAIANNLNLTAEIFVGCVKQFNTTNHIESASIKLDITRTFPSLQIFQKDGPLFESLYNLLAAYCIFKPEIGYVQGMSFIGAMLILNMDATDAFICLANLFNNNLYHNTAFTLNEIKINNYWSIYNELLFRNLPCLHKHFFDINLTPDFYLLDWLFTIYAKAMPLDVTSRIWDIFVRDGDEFLFKTAIGILILYKNELLSMDFVHVAQFLIKLPDTIKVDDLFKCIKWVNMKIGDRTFDQMILLV
ncbi:TBC1 domain family member 12-like [Microplitis mediator]|uniref:TBC1 domain family member 12-like n=1 Tax=Microplitis mediator TaxID=375433 RepID=UPI0025568ECC|nr:TBC1 domain family member 12-like [Microplitis mediator]XP_057340164.1 TBC1 domain family member 12-like [Microplitis mediator]XP_057340165.1 TBC1 domain family member 12-like [Microplitis mediator]